MSPTRNDGRPELDHHQSFIHTQHEILIFLYLKARAENGGASIFE
jgi:hypothetical protein